MSFADLKQSRATLSYWKAFMKKVEKLNEKGGGQTDDRL